MAVATEDTHVFLEPSLSKIGLDGHVVVHVQPRCMVNAVAVILFGERLDIVAELSVDLARLSQEASANEVA